jgi:hypothetical protein
MAKLAKHVTVRRALLYVDDNPDWPDTPRLDMPIWELIARNLFDIANNPDRSKGAMNQAIRAQRIILNRTTGVRRTGTAPATKNAVGVKLVDLTKGIVTPEPEVPID